MIYHLWQKITNDRQASTVYYNINMSEQYSLGEFSSMTMMILFSGMHYIKISSNGFKMSGTNQILVDKSSKPRNFDLMNFVSRLRLTDPHENWIRLARSRETGSG